MPESKGCKSRLFTALQILSMMLGILLTSVTSGYAATSTQDSPVLLRLEDVSPGGPYKNVENLQKLCVIAAYLQQEDVPFQVSVTPRNVEPASGYDVSITDDTEYMKKFIAVIKTLEEDGGIIGLHGYTHQIDSSNSVEGFEFYNVVKNQIAPKTYDYAAERVKNAIDLFLKKGIFPAYWETPHYAASPQQHIAFEEQIGLCYDMNFQRLQTLLNFKVINYNEQNYCGLDIVPTPLGYFRSNHCVDSMLRWLDFDHKAGVLASYFYHPTIELNYISKAYDTSGKAYYIYDPDSPLHQLIKSIKDRGYTFVSIYSLVGFVPAQRLVNISISDGDRVFTGRFDPDSVSESILVWNKNTNQWHMYKDNAVWYAPRKENTFDDRGIWLKGLSLYLNTVPFVGYFHDKTKEDLLLISQKLGSITLAENKGQRFIPHSQKWEVIKNLKSIQFTTGDLNGDGLTDLCIYDPDNSRIGAAINQDGLFDQIIWRPFEPLKSENVTLLTGDFNGDGKRDIIVIDCSKKEYQMLIAGTTEKGILSRGSLIKRIDQGNDTQPFVADINGDSKDELLFYTERGLWERFIYNSEGFQYDGTFGPWGSNQGIPTVADLNAD